MKNLVHIPKLIETSLPLEAINAASAREKSIRHGHPSTLHLWWARRPLASARAVIFASMVNDPLWKYGAHPTPQQKSAATKKRKELHGLIEEMVKWENTTDEKLFGRAHEAILESWREICEANGWGEAPLPAFHDPFAGGGALPLEAQRLGLESYASDLNPVAVMINKAMIEIPPKFAGREPVGPIPPEESRRDLDNAEGLWKGAAGLAEDVRRYGLWMREEAKKRIGHLYPQIEVTAEMAAKRPDLNQYVGQKLTVIAWLWARTVKSPNPMFAHVDVPLVSSYVLSSKKGKEAWVEPVIDESSWHFEVRTGTPPKGAEEGNKHKLSRSSVAFDCILSKMPISGDYIKAEGMAGRMGARMMAVVCEGERGRVYLSPTDEVLDVPEPSWLPPGRLPARRITGGTCVPYGLDEWWKLFTKRQLVALNTFSDLVKEAREKVIADIGETLSCGIKDDANAQSGVSSDAVEYANAVATYLAFAVSCLADIQNNLCTWKVDKTQVVHLFTRQSIGMIWNFAENNIFNNAAGDYMTRLESIIKVIKTFGSKSSGFASQSDAQTQMISAGKVVSTDPPYYDNISYADLADFFYVWMRRSLREIYPDLFATMATPKDEELVATPYKHGGRENAEAFFMDGMTAAMANLARQAHPAYPVTIYYAFKQGESNESGTGNAGWETFLEAVIRAGFAITGTWPMRTELGNRMIGQGTNALASSIVLVCRKRDDGNMVATKRDFLAELKRVMPGKLEAMTEGGAVAPVDLAQTAIGPGMEIYSKYESILKQDGTRMSVHEALVEINRYLDGDDDDYDSQTRFLYKWFSDYGWSERDFGEANVLARAKGTSVVTLVDSGAFASAKGYARLVHWKDYPVQYDPAADRNRPTWEALHHLVRALMVDGEKAAGVLLARMPEVTGGVRSLAYRLYVNCERRGMADDARIYNALVMSWGEIEMAKEEAVREGRGRWVQETFL